MATPSYKWYQTSVLAWMWNEDAIQQSRSEIPWYNMFSTNTQTTNTQNTDVWSKDREVEVWLWVKLVQPMSDMEKTEYVNSLTDDQYRQMQKYKNEWYSFEASRTLLENSEWLKNPTARWTDKYRPKGSFFKNMVAWAYDSVTWLPRFLSDNLAKAVWWTAKKLWADEDKVNYLVQDFIDFGRNEMSWKALWADTQSATYKITKWIWDIAQTVAWEKLAVNALQGTAKWASLLSKADKLKQSWLLGKMAVWAAEWAADMWLYNVISESELPTWEDLALWAAFWAAFPLAWAWLKAGKKILRSKAKTAAAKLELNWLINPAKLTEVKDRLIQEWADLADIWLKGWTAEDVWSWLVERGFKWDKPTIANDLWEWATKARTMKNKVLASSTTTHQVKAADDALQDIFEAIYDVRWLENRAARVQELIWKNNWQYTLSELEEILNTFDATFPIYTKAWTLKEWNIKQWLGNIRYALKKYIEDAATKEWLWNIKMLNNEIQVAKALQDWITRKDSADAVREIMSMFGKYAPWGIAWWVLWWPFDKDTLSWRLGNMVVGALAGKYLFSTKTKTNFAALLNKMSGWTKKELERWLWWEIKTLSKEAMKEVETVLRENPLALPVPVEWAVNDAWYTILEQWEKMIWTKEWKSIIQNVWDITEIWWWNMQWYVNSSQAVIPQVEVPTPKAQTKVVEQTKAVEQTPKVSETVVNSEKPNLREIFWDKYYKQLEEQVELINRSRVWAKNWLTWEPLNLKPITVEDLDMSSDLYKREFENYWYKEMEEIQKEYSKINAKYPPAKITDAMQKQLDKAKTQAEKDKLLEKWRNEYIEKNPLSDEDLAKVEELINRSNEINERFKKIQDYLYWL